MPAIEYRFLSDLYLDKTQTYFCILFRLCPDSSSEPDKNFDIKKSRSERSLNWYRWWKHLDRANPDRQSGRQWPELCLGIDFEEYV